MDWDEIVQRDGPSLWRTACRLLGNTHDADECLQEAFLATWNHSRSEPIRHCSAFLRTTLVRTALNRLKRRVCSRQASGGLPADLPVPAQEPNPEQVMMGQELAERLRSALSRLPEGEAEVACLCLLEEMEHREVAKVLGISVTAVGVRLFRARGRLREMLGVDTDESRKLQ